MRRDQINTLKNTNLDTVIEVRDSGLYAVENKDIYYNGSKTLQDLLDNKFKQSETYIEIKNTPNISIQIIHTSTYEVKRTGIKGKFKYKWTDWCKTLETSIENPDSLSTIKRNTNLSSFADVKESLKNYIKSIKGASYIDIDKGKQSVYNDLELKRLISKLVDKSRRNEIVPHDAVVTESDIRDKEWLQKEILEPTNKDWLSVNRLETWDNGRITVNRIMAYTFNGNPNDFWSIMRADNDSFHILGHERFTRVIFEGHYRPRVTQSDPGCFAFNIDNRGSAFMIQEDLNWKWLYNGGRVGFVHINPNLCNDVYYKGTPDFGIGWPSSYSGSGTHGIPQNWGDWTRWNFWENRYRDFGIWGQNIEQVLYR